MNEYVSGKIYKIAYNCAQLSLTHPAIIYLQTLGQRVNILENINTFLNKIKFLILFYLYYYERNYSG